MFENFIWDFDGTLINSFPSIMKCYKMFFDENNIIEDETYILNIIKTESSEKAIEYLENKYPFFKKEEFLKAYLKNSRLEEILCSVSCMPYAEDMCKLIKKNKKLNFIITNRDETCISILKYLNMLELFDFVMYYGRDGINVKKPDIRPFSYVIKKFDLNPQKTLSIGDRKLDLITSKKANLKTCLYNNEYDFDLKADYKISSLDKLKYLIIK